MIFYELIGTGSRVSECLFVLLLQNQVGGDVVVVWILKQRQAKFILIVFQKDVWESGK